jgi:hypothetical protein
MALSLIWQTADQLRRERDARQREKADSKDEYELAYWGLGWRKKGPRD